jgi:translation initiation factor IF-3
VGEEKRRTTINRNDSRGRDLGPRINYRIRVPEVRVIDENGEQLGILNTREALAIAQERSLDLVEVAPNSAPPVCRILDYGKFKYEESKKQKEARKNAQTVEIKGIRLRPTIDPHDFEYRTEDARRFLQKRNKVQVTLIFRGREMAHPEIGRAQMEKLASAVAEVGVVERPPVIDGRRMTMLLAPK